MVENLQSQGILSRAPNLGRDKDGEREGRLGSHFTIISSAKFHECFIRFYGPATRHSPHLPIRRPPPAPPPAFHPLVPPNSTSVLFASMDSKHENNIKFTRRRRRRWPYRGNSRILLRIREIFLGSGVATGRMWPFS